MSKNVRCEKAAIEIQSLSSTYEVSLLDDLSEICAALKENFSYVRLGYVQGNEQPKHFWLKKGFVPTETVTKTESYDIVVMRKRIGSCACLDTKGFL